MVQVELNQQPIKVVINLNFKTGELLVVMPKVVIAIVVEITLIMVEPIPCFRIAQEARNPTSFPKEELYSQFHQERNQVHEVYSHYSDHTYL